MGSQETVAITQIETQRLGYISLSLTGMRTSSVLNVAVGTKLELGNSLFYVDTAEEPSGFSAITTGNTAICYAVVAGSGSTASIHFDYSGTFPTWSDDKQGWYNGTNRAVYMCFKAGATVQRGVVPITQDSKMRFEQLPGIRGYYNNPGGGIAYVYLYGNNGLLLVGVDVSGSSWTIINTGTYEDILGVFVSGSSDSELLMYGSNGLARKSINNGIAWGAVAPGLSGDIVQGVSLDGSTLNILCTITGEIAYSSDGGSTWTASVYA